MLFRVVKKAQIYVPNCWFFNSTNIGDFQFSNWNFLKKFPYWYKFNIVSNLRRNQLQFDDFEKLIFVSKNWPIDVRVDWKAPSSLIVSEVNLEEELNEFSNSFKRGNLKVD
jgi:hypothetical protein